MPWVIFYLDDRKERNLILVMHILFIFYLFSNFLDAYTLGYICNLFNIIFNVILKAHAIFISVLLLVTLSVAQATKFTVNFVDVQVALWM